MTHYKLKNNYKLRINYTNNKEFNINRKLYEQLMLEIKTNNIDYIHNFNMKHKIIPLKRGTPFVIKTLEMYSNKEITKDELEYIITLMKNIGISSNNKINIQFIYGSNIIYNYNFQSGNEVSLACKNKKNNKFTWTQYNKNKLELKSKPEPEQESESEPEPEPELEQESESESESEPEQESESVIDRYEYYCTSMNSHKFIYYFLSYFFGLWFVSYCFLVMLYNM